MKNETKLKERIQGILKTIPDLWYVKVQQVSVRGTADLLICYRGKFFAYELKSDTGSLDPLQRYTLNNITKAGGIARVVTKHNMKEFLAEDFGWEK